MAETMLEARIAAVRAFNRYYTRKLGVLQEGLLESAFSLAEVRVLYELAHRERPTATDLGRDLALDAGYLSRILGNLARRGLIAKRSSRLDGRQQLLSLTKKGRAAFAVLDRRARDEVAALLDPLSRVAQRRLVEAMRTIERLVGP
jgi:DNA-binding MarR family transcriptional regulator